MTLSTLVIGLVGLAAFGIYEWKFTKTGIVNHDLFNHEKKAVRSFIISLVLMFIEGFMLFTFIIFYPVL